MSTENTEERTFTKEELDAMPAEAANNIMMLATKIEGTVVVRDKDGNIKYDNPALAGTYGET